MTLVLASSSATRRSLLAAAGLTVEAIAPRIDEAAIKAALRDAGAVSRDIADALAEAKARKVSQRRADALVLGCDQVLDHRGIQLSKPETPDEARRQLRALSDDRHELFSAVVAYEGGAPVWRHVGVVRMSMRSLSQDYIASYVARNWEAIRHSAGSYTLEGEGMRLFTAVDGQYFDVLGLSMIPLLSWLIERGTLEA